MRNGFTLVEVIVALVLLQIAMLALAGTTAVAARDFATARRDTRAQMLARNRLALLRAQTCPAAGSGSVSVAGGFAERWTVEGAGSLRRITVVVDYAQSRGRAGHVALTGTTLCSA